MDYSPWVEREIWPFLRVTVSLKRKRPRPPKLVCMHNSSIFTCINFLGRFRLIKFFDDMDYSPWVEREIWPFLRVAISPKPKRSRPPKLVCMYVISTPTCMNFLSRFRWIKFFDDHGRKGNLAVFESSNISETKEDTPTKISVHVCYINTYLHDFFEPILID